MTNNLTKIHAVPLIIGLIIFAIGVIYLFWPQITNCLGNLEMRWLGWKMRRGIK